MNFTKIKTYLICPIVPRSKPCFGTGVANWHGVKLPSYFARVFIFLVIFSGVFGAAGKSEAATIDAMSCEREDVQMSINEAQSGDRVQVPAGECTWNSQIIIPSNKTIWLNGSGSDKTIITLGISSALKIGNGLGDNVGSRVSNFGFYSNNIDAFIFVYGAVAWRFDHNVFDWTNYWNAQHANGNYVYIQGAGDSEGSVPYGVIDNNIIRDAKIVCVGRGASPRYMGYTNNAWMRPFSWGLSKDGKTVYVEDNTIYKRSGNPIDANYGGEYVLRYNDIDDASNTLVHGVQGGNRAGRYWELYGNHLNRTATTSYTQFRARAGTGVFFYNKVEGNQPFSNYFLLDIERSTENVSYMGSCDGTSPWDGNEGLLDAPGYPCRDQIGRPFDESLWRVFNITSCVDNGSGMVRINAPGHDLTEIDNKVMILYGGAGGCGEGFEGSHNILSFGDDYVDINLTYTSPLISGPGIMSGHPPSQPLKPAYEWVNQNTRYQNLLHFALHYPSAQASYIKPDRDYFNYTTSFDGSSGVGCGTLANRPQTCTPSVGYWATNQSCSDLTGMIGINPANPISGTLYKCTTPDTWTEYYTPYTYPHPLRNESDIMAPVAPNGLSIQ